MLCESNCLIVFHIYSVVVDERLFLSVDMPTLDLKKDVFRKFGPVDERLSVALVQKAKATAEPRWLLHCFTDDACTVSLTFRALLATKCKCNEDVSAALDKLLGSEMNIVDEGSLSKVFQDVKDRAKTEQTITNIAISNLVNGILAQSKLYVTFKVIKY
jgi:hypothetical protein